MKIGIVIQARMGSTRLPGKVLMPLGEKTVLDWVVESCQRSKRADEVIVATSDQSQDDAIARHLAQKEISFFRGEESNVLKRFYDCAYKHKLDLIVRVTADCPFLDPDVIDRLIDLSVQSQADYTGTASQTIRTFPHGIDAEVIVFPALEEAFQNARSDFEKEHVCPYIHTTKSQDFKQVYLEAKKKEYAPEIRITLDTQQDYDACKALVKVLPKAFNTETIVSIYKKNPQLKEINPV